jgi:type I restriction enzyme S subunit
MSGGLKNEWSMKPIKAVAKVISGATPSRDEPSFWNGSIPWITPKELSRIDDPVITETQEMITDTGYRRTSCEMLPVGSVLLSSRAPIGHIAIAGVSMCTNQGFKSLVPNPGVASRYLYWALQSRKDGLIALGRGATFKEVSKPIVEDFELPFPASETEQNRIAAILDKADAIRRKRQQALRLTDDFLRSVFLDMFGDPVTNPNEWPTKQLLELGRVSTGSTPPSSSAEMFGGSIPFITPGDLKETWTNSARTVTEAGARSARTIRAGAALVCCIGATIGKMGKAKILSAFNQQINAVEWNGLIVDDYGLDTLKFYKQIIASRGSSTTLPILNKSAFQSLEIPVAPIEMQQAYAKIVRQCEATKNQAVQAQSETEELFASLQQRAFSGQL